MNEIEEEVDFSKFNNKKVDPINTAPVSAFIVQEPEDTGTKFKHKQILYIATIIITLAASVFIYFYFYAAPSTAPKLPPGHLPPELQKPGIPTLPPPEKISSGGIH